MSENYRITWIDMAKGYGIILVILAHIDISGIPDVGKQWMFSFHIPLFFFLSGFVFTFEKEFCVFFRKKTKSIIVPYFCLGTVMLIYIGFNLYLTNEFVLRDYLKTVFCFVIQRRMWTLWFLACLFILNMLFYLILKLFKENVLLIWLGCVFLPIIGLVYYKNGGGALPWNADVCTMAYPFFCMGYMYKLHKKNVDVFFSKRTVLLFVLGACTNLLSWYIGIRVSGKMVDMYSSSYGVAPLFYLAAVSGISCVVIMSKWIVIKPIMYIGKNSLLYFAWHQTILLPTVENTFSRVRELMMDETNLMHIYLYKVAVLVVVLCVSTVFNILITKSKLRFMLGKY